MFLTSRRLGTTLSLELEHAQSSPFQILADSEQGKCGTLSHTPETGRYWAGHWQAHTLRIEEKPSRWILEG